MPSKVFNICQKKESSSNACLPKYSADFANRKGGKTAYKHVPHREKPPHLVQRRNARERRRVQAVNNAFAKLRKAVPIENRNKRVSKVKTLQKAIEYIESLQDILADAPQYPQYTTQEESPSPMTISPPSISTTSSETSHASSVSPFSIQADSYNVERPNVNLNKENYIDPYWLQVDANYRAVDSIGSNCHNCNWQ